MGLAKPSMYLQWGSKVEHRDSTWKSVRPRVGSECTMRHLPVSTAGQGLRDEVSHPEPDPAARWRKERGTGVSILCPVHCCAHPLANRRHRKLLFQKFGYRWPESQWWNNTNREQKIFHPALHRGKERTHHLLKSEIQSLRFADPRDAACPGASRAWQGWR